MGISSRLLSLVLSGEFLQHDSRIVLINKVIDGLKENPLGYGLWGDRYLCQTYCHNFLYEMLATFGVILGPILLLALFVTLVKHAFKRPSVHKKVLFCLIPIGLFKLMFSSSMLEEPAFFAMMSLLFFRTSFHGGINAKEDCLELNYPHR